MTGELIAWNEDKRRAVMTLLNDEEWEKWSDREIARRCAVGHAFVSSLRLSLSMVDSDKPTEKTYTTKHGTTSTMHTGNIGRRPAPSPGPTPEEAEEPEDDLDTNKKGLSYDSPFRFLQSSISDLPYPFPADPALKSANRVQSQALPEGTDDAPLPLRTMRKKTVGFICGEDTILEFRSGIWDRIFKRCALLPCISGEGKGDSGIVDLSFFSVFRFDPCHEPAPNFGNCERREPPTRRIVATRGEP